MNFDMNFDTAVERTHSVCPVTAGRRKALCAYNYVRNA